MRMVLKGLKHLVVEETGQLTKTPQKNEKKLQVLGCAICRTDAKMWSEGHRDLVFPRVLGHEMVVADTNQIRYAVWPGISCGQCRFCQTGRENLCEDMKINGFHNDGGFAGNVVLNEESLIALPDEMGTHAACFTEPVGCVINAFSKFSTKSNGRVLIYGGGTVGLIAALYALYIGLVPLIIEKNEAKIQKVAPFLDASGIKCVKETADGEFDVVINACPDFIAFCQGIVKVAKGGHLSFFSGLLKNEHIETNLLNLLHYKEAIVSGAYGLTRKNMQDAIPFIENQADLLNLLIEDVITPHAVPDLMPHVLSGNHLKYIIDFTQPMEQSPHNETGITPFTQSDATQVSDVMLPTNSLGHRIIQNIQPVGEDLLAAATTKIDNKTKPLGALGILENVAVKMCCIQQNLSPEIKKKQLLVFAADHGITEEGISAFPAEVTGQMVENFLNGGAAINVLCHHNRIDLQVVDMGVKKVFDAHPMLIDAKVRQGTNNFAIQDAMRADEMQQALENGMHAFLEIYEKNEIEIVGLGEMGIGNTTSASAIISAVTGITPAQATGRGTGVDDKGLQHKAAVIEKALNFHTLNGTNGFEILMKIGGFEIAGMAGAALAAASNRVPVVLDGLISTAAGLVAYVINPGIQGYLFSGHKSVEKAQKAALNHMDLKPMVDFNMRLGEGTGAALAIDVIAASCNIITQMASFDDAMISRSD